MSFFYTILCFDQSHLGELRDTEVIFQIIPGSYQSDKPINIIGVDKTLFKADCIDGSIVNGVRQPLLCSFSLGNRPGYKIFKEPRVKFLRRKNKSLLFQKTIYIDDNNNKPVYFDRKTVNFTCQLTKKENF